jgi:aerobic-type carbon monoxide dehydrogenase small subunit (CoxS/CutS family)
MDYVSLLVRSAMAKLDAERRGGERSGLDPSTPLLQVVRNTLGVTGTKYACGIAKRGAYTIILDENPCLQRVQIPLRLCGN